ncbi:MAG: HAMP domain-containing histidine kinase [Bdellovibrionaceae bacterium]|nr:HAMP domain-containing histidine kinase [Pseudobdellovibrionaceae bacterium]
MDLVPSYHVNFENKRLHLLLKQNSFFIFGLIANIFAFFYITLPYIPLPKLTVWTLIIIIITISRFIISNKSLQRLNSIKNLKALKNIEYYYALGALCSGCMWTISSFFMLPHGDLSHHALYGFLLAGMVAAATTGYAVSPITFICSIVPIALPFIFRMIYEGTPLHYLMSVMVAVFMIFSIAIFKTIHRFSLDSLNFGLNTQHELQRLTEKQSELAYTARMATLGELSTNIAHEINNPLAVLKMGINIIQQKINSDFINKPEIQDLCQRLENNILRISETIIVLKAFSVDNKGINFEEIELYKLTKECLDLAKSKFKYHNIDIHLVNPEKEILVYCYPIQIRQVMINLINNAYDALLESHKEKKWIKIQFNENKESTQITITDSGSGIPKDIQNNIFHPFFTTKPGSMGTGLGLAMVSGIIQKHHGRIWVNNNSPNTEFVIEIPKLMPKEISLKKIS